MDLINNQNWILCEDEDNGDGLLGFSNFLVESDLNRSLQAGELSNINTFKNSIYNFNRLGMTKSLVRAKIFDDQSLKKTANRFSSLGDASSKISRLREYSFERQITAQKKQISKLAGALDDQMVLEKRTLSEKQRFSPNLFTKGKSSSLINLRNDSRELIRPKLQQLEPFFKDQQSLFKQNLNRIPIKYENNKKYL